MSAVGAEVKGSHACALALLPNRRWCADRGGLGKQACDLINSYSRSLTSNDVEDGLDGREAPSSNKVCDSVNRALFSHAMLFVSRLEVPLWTWLFSLGGESWCPHVLKSFLCLALPCLSWHQISPPTASWHLQGQGLWAELHTKLGPFTSPRPQQSRPIAPPLSLWFSSFWTWLTQKGENSNQNVLSCHW